MPPGADRRGFSCGMTPVLVLVLCCSPVALTQSTGSTSSASPAPEGTTAGPSRLTTGMIVGALAALAAAAALVLCVTAVCEMRRGPCCGVRHKFLATCCGLWPLSRKSELRFSRSPSGISYNASPQTASPRQQPSPQQQLLLVPDRGSATRPGVAPLQVRGNPLKVEAAAKRASGPPRPGSGDSPLLRSPRGMAATARESPLQARERIPSFHTQAFPAESVVRGGAAGPRSEGAALGPPPRGVGAPRRGVA